MLDQISTRSEATTQISNDTYELVVVGAGIAGLNALFAATEYLPKGAKVLLLDRKVAAGGMWNTAYDYVRLHQPHPMFTVGNLKWDWRKPAAYLAARNEVQTHLAKSLGPISEAVNLQTRFGVTVTSCNEVKTDAGYHAEVIWHPADQTDQTQMVRANRVIYASGLNYEVTKPLHFSSDSVVSIIPQELTKTLAAHPDAPVYVIGGGKTGMDTILSVAAENPHRKIVLVKGPGTLFLNRTKYLPTGTERWTSGRLISRLFLDLAEQFDGTNEDETMAFIRSQLASDTKTDNGVFLYGLQSEEERDRIDKTLAQTLPGYLSDIEKTANGQQLRLRDGQMQDIPAGSIVVNCTGSFFRSKELAEAHDFLSPGNTVMHINPRDGWHFLTSVVGFFATHLLYRDALRGQGFYSMDHEALFRQNRKAWVGASAAQAYMNQAISVQTLPLMLLDRCGLDLDRWYPLPRRLAGLVHMKTNAAQNVAQCRATLDRTAERFGIHCAQLD